jgi:hypothetical protein
MDMVRLKSDGTEMNGMEIAQDDFDALCHQMGVRWPARIDTPGYTIGPFAGFGTVATGATADVNYITGSILSYDRQLYNFGISGSARPNGYLIADTIEWTHDNAGTTTTQYILYGASWYFVHLPQSGTQERVVPLRHLMSQENGLFTTVNASTQIGTNQPRRCFPIPGGPVAVNVQSDFLGQKLSGGATAVTLAATITFSLGIGGLAVTQDRAMPLAMSSIGDWCARDPREMGRILALRRALGFPVAQRSVPMI